MITMLPEPDESGTHAIILSLTFMAGAGIWLAGIMFSDPTDNPQS
jgi:hypothetical protein